MIRALEWGVAGVAAIALHVAAFAWLPPDAAGAIAAGDQGQALVSLTASDAGVVEMVAKWEAAPDLPPLPPVLKPPVMTETVVEMPAVETSGTVALPPTLTAPLAEPKPEAEPAPEKPKPAPEKPAPERTKPEPAAEPPKAKAKTPAAKGSPAQAAQKPSGAGGGESAGTAGKAAAATLSQGETEAAMATWGGSIRAKVERRKAYPAAAKGASGKVTLRLKVAASGQLQSVSVVKSSGNAALDQAAVKAVKAAGRFPKAPKGLGSSSFTLPISFKP